MKPLKPSTVATLDSFDSAIAFFGSLTPEPGQLLVFRGHADDSWWAGPSIFRQTPDISGCENQIIRELISLYPHEFVHDRTMFDQLVRMQHFGLPTRLLDVTTNPLVALYFAVDPFGDDSVDGAVIILRIAGSRRKYYDSDTVSCLCNIANLTSEERESITGSAAKTIRDFNKAKSVDRLLQFIRIEKPYFRSEIKKVDLFRPVHVVPKMSNRRLSAQFGSFVVFGLDPTKGPSYNRDNSSRSATIPADAKAKIRARLEALGIHGGTLFPEIDRAARQIVHRFQTRS